MTYEDWVRGYFDQTESRDFFSTDTIPPDLPPAEVIAHATRLFSISEESLTPYTDTQIGKGFWALIGEGNPTLHELCNLAIPIGERIACIRAMEGIYARLFVNRCSESLGHLNEPSGALNVTCYMWWDIVAIDGDGFFDFESNVMHDATLQVMERALALPHAACQESALHGLGHWNHHRSDVVQDIILKFLTSGKARRPELVDYAENAAKGMIA